MRDLGIGARHITISTVGLVPQIRRFADECAETGLEIKLAISLHEADDIKRSSIMPVNRKHDLSELMDACQYYVKQSGRRLTFEWALIAGQNDDVETAAELARLLKPVGKCHVNLIPLNPTKGFDGKPASLPNAEGFVRVLESRGIPATVRVRRGIDIDAGCGQLAEEASKEIAKERLERKLRNARERIEEWECEWCGGGLTREVTRRGTEKTCALNIQATSHALDLTLARHGPLRTSHLCGQVLSSPSQNSTMRQRRSPLVTPATKCGLERRRRGNRRSRGRARARCRPPPPSGTRRLQTLLFCESIAITVSTEP